ncbi:hypothetical protein ACFL6Y_10315 [Elusimicrobiota bacterium]
MNLKSIIVASVFFVISCGPSVFSFDDVIRRINEEDLHRFRLRGPAPVSKEAAQVSGDAIRRIDEEDMHRLRLYRPNNSPLLDLKKMPEPRQKFQKYLDSHPGLWPGLSRDNWEMNEDGGIYNCISHTAGEYFGSSLYGSLYVREFDGFYARHGYKPMGGMDFSFHPGYQKVVLYGKPCPDGKCRPNAGASYYEDFSVVLKGVDDPAMLFFPLHAIIQESDGSFMSKMGKKGPLIRILSPNVLNGPAFGQPMRVYIRKN